MPDAPTPWPGEDARIVGTRLDRGVPAYEEGELTREDWPLRLLKRELNESICMMINMKRKNARTKRNGLILFILANATTLARVRFIYMRAQIRRNSH